MSPAVRALLISLVERYFLVALALASSIIISRLLTPEEIGIYSLGLAVLGVAQVLRNFGVSGYLIQAPTLDDTRIAAALGVSIALGMVLGLLVLAATPLVVAFYGEPRLAPVLLISAASFLVLPLGTVSLSVLSRSMHFGKVLAANVAGGVGGFAVTVSMATAGVGATSMALGTLAGAIVTAFVAWYVQPDRRLVKPSFKGGREVLRYGAQSTSASIVTTISMDINDLAIGKVLGLAPVALSSRAQGLMNFVHRDAMTAVRNAAFPLFAHAHREGRHLERPFVDATAAVTVVAWPFYGFVSLFALEALRLLYGPQWDAAAPLVPLFCLGGAIGAAASLVLTLTTAVGRVDLASRVDLIFQPLRAIAVVAAAVLFRTLEACAWVYSLSFIAFVPMAFAAKGRCTGNDWRMLAVALARSLAVAVVALLPAWVMHMQMGSGIRTMLLAIFPVFVSWSVALIVVRHPILGYLPGRFLARRSP